MKISAWNEFFAMFYGTIWNWKTFRFEGKRLEKKEKIVFNFLRGEKAINFPIEHENRELIYVNLYTHLLFNANIGSYVDKYEVKQLRDMTPLGERTEINPTWFIA